MKLTLLPDNDPLKHLIADARDQLYRVALAWCGDAMLADDLAQDTVATAIAKRGQLRDPQCLRAWLYRILNNKWYRHLQLHRNDGEMPDTVLSEEAGPSARCQELELVRQVRQAVAALPEKERQVISLVDLEELSYCDVAAALNIPIGTVMSRLHRARRHLLDRLDNPSGTQHLDSARIIRLK